MGITYHQAKTLWEARQRGVSFAETLTVAHLSLNLHPVERERLRRARKASDPAARETALDHYAFGDYADAFLRDFLGVVRLDILDYSAYEGATTCHDLNEPVPPSLHGQFDAVIDGGSLEHVFNFPVAIANLMNMVKLGGTVFLETPANNLCGHGFYQFSPELMFRVFTEDNGFELVQVTLQEARFPGVELVPRGRVYHVTDPEDAHARVGLVSKKPVMMMVQATKIAVTPPFARAPLQSDYVSKWSQQDISSRRSLLTRALAPVFHALPFAVRARIVGFRQLRRFSFSNRKFYEKV